MDFAASHSKSLLFHMFYNNSRRRPLMRTSSAYSRPKPCDFDVFYMHSSSEFAWHSKNSLTHARAHGARKGNTFTLTPIIFRICFKFENLPYTCSTMTPALHCQSAMGPRRDARSVYNFGSCVPPGH